MVVGSSSRASNPTFRSTGSGAFGDLPPGEPLDAELTSPKATPPPKMSYEAGPEAVTEPVPSGQQMPEQLPSHGSIIGADAKLAAEQVLQHIYILHHNRMIMLL